MSPRTNRTKSLSSPFCFTLCIVLGGCMTPAEYAAAADEQVYGILRAAAKAVNGREKAFSIERPVDTLRARLLASGEAVTLDLKSALDVAAENSRQYQQQRESLYRAALTLTREQHDFAIRFGGGGAADVDGTDDDSAQIAFRHDLAASVNTQSGGRLVASFATTWLRNLINQDDLNGSSLLRVTFTQPLLAGFGQRIVREPLTQAERDVVYAMRDFERFRSDFALRIVRDYYNILSQLDNLKNTGNNHQSLVRDRIRLDALQEANRGRAEDRAQAKQREFDADNRVILAKANLEGTFDRFKLTLGLPVDAGLSLDPGEFTRLGTVKLEGDDLKTEHLIAYALGHRLDYRTAKDEVADAGRNVIVAEDTLRSTLDFSSAIDVPTEGSSKPFTLDWDKVTWSAGFDLDLALDRLPQRNAYRNALIALQAAMRAVEQLDDQIRAEVRQTLRDLRSLEKTFQIQQGAVRLAELRVERTEDFFKAQNRFNTTTRDILEAKDDLLAAQLQLTRAVVDFAVAKLQLLRDLEALPLEPKGLRYDPGLPIPAEALHPPASLEPKNTEEKPR